jgi:hypothetical protein
MNNNRPTLLAIINKEFLKTINDGNKNNFNPNYFRYELYYDDKYIERCKNLQNTELIAYIVNFSIFDK